MNPKKNVLNRCSFSTERLAVQGWDDYLSHSENSSSIYERIAHILTPDVTEALPTSWGDVKTSQEVKHWLEARQRESSVFAVILSEERVLAGFIFLIEGGSTGEGKIDLRLGYLLSKETWGKGLGSELIKGLVSWGEHEKSIASITGGVEVNNQASIRVLEKNGFAISSQEQEAEGVTFLVRNFTV